MPDQERPPRVQTIELTSKRYKAMMLVGSLLLIVGIVSSILTGFAVWCMVPLVLGAGLYIVGHVLAWWNHG